MDNLSCVGVPRTPADPCSRESVLRVLKESHKREVEDEERNFTTEQKSKRRYWVETVEIQHMNIWLFQRCVFTVNDFHYLFIYKPQGSVMASYSGLLQMKVVKTFQATVKMNLCSGVHIDRI